MIMNKFIAKHIIFPLHEAALGRSTMHCLAELEKTQYLDDKSLGVHQTNKLQALVEHAYKNVPYYHDLFDDLGLKPSDMRSLEDIKKIPLLSKKEIRSKDSSFIAKNIKPLTRWTTGGSTGEPLIFYVDNLRMSYNAAAKLRSRRWWGVDMGDTELCFWGSPIENSSQTKFKTFRDNLLNIKLLSAYHLTKEIMEHYTRAIKKMKPRHIFGYGTGLFIFAKYIIENKHDLSDCGIKVVFSTAEKLYDFQKRIISQAFCCPVADNYGGRESGFIGCECPEGKMHLSSDKMIIEIIKDGKPVKNGQEGEVVITNLNSYGMPFLRYRTDDIGVIDDKQCTCGRTLPVLTKILGRSQDVIVAPNGKIIHWVFFMKLIEGIEGVEQFRVTQKKIDDISIAIVPNKKFSNGSIEPIKKNIIDMVGSPINIDIELCESIPLNKSGKFKWIISELNNS